MLDYCTLCDEHGIAIVDLRTVIGDGWLLEYGNAYIDPIYGICPNCHGKKVIEGNRHASPV